MPNHSVDDHKTGREADEKQDRRSRSQSRIPWTQVSEVMIAAIVGSLVTILISPFSQSLSFYFSQFLSRPILSIEYVELVPVDPVIAIDGSMVRSLVQSPGFRSFVSQQPAVQTMIYAGVGGTLSVAQAKSMTSGLRQLETDLHTKLARIRAVERDLTNVSEPRTVKSIIQTYSGPMFNSFAFSNASADQMKASFLTELKTEARAAFDLVNAAQGILKSIRDASLPIANVHFKVSVLNRGDTDGLVRSVGTLELSDAHLSAELLRIAPPRPLVSTENSMAVPVAVVNPPDAIREQSVGRVEKHSMIELWFKISERQLSPAQRDSLKNALPLTQSSKLAITLSDQERSPIRYTTLSHQGP